MEKALPRGPAGLPDPPKKKQELNKKKHVNLIAFPSPRFFYVCENKSGVVSGEVYATEWYPRCIRPMFKAARERFGYEDKEKYGALLLEDDFKGHAIDAAIEEEPDGKAKEEKPKAKAEEEEEEEEEEKDEEEKEEEGETKEGGPPRKRPRRENQKNQNKIVFDAD